MPVCVLPALALALAWVEIGGGLPAGDDITAMSFGNGADDILVGTTAGYVFRTLDGGETYQPIFTPQDTEPLVEPRLHNLASAAVDDLGRGHDRNMDPRDRAGSVKAAANLAGEVRDNPQIRATPLLASLVRETARERAAVTQIQRCAPATFLLTPESLWRSTDDGLRFEQLNVGPSGLRSAIYWITCDPARKGHVALNTAAGVLESFDLGETFFMFGSAFPDGAKVDGIDFRADGRLVVTAQGRVFVERQGGGGYEAVCNYRRGDSVEGKLDWIWWTEGRGRPVLYLVTGDGIVVCDDGKLKRLDPLGLGRVQAEFVWIDDAEPGHILAATKHEVYESFDAGASFKLAFVVPTERSVRKLLMDGGRKGDLLVATGGQIFRRVQDDDGARKRAVAGREAAVTERLMSEAPLWQVLQTALARMELAPERVAERRVDSMFRNLMPDIAVRASYAMSASPSLRTPRFDAGADPRFPQSGAPDDFSAFARTRGGAAYWSVVAVWDLREIIADRYTSDRLWADVERLRQKMTFRVQDEWVAWGQASVKLSQAGLSRRARLFHELKRREAAAILNQMTGGGFAVFATDGAGRTRARE
ncbi:MAG: hypothetical protein HY903_15290 [Deltaproteobacteria bacterium]|nr:hypothetical protein [Deltaproteobacteria bacterium]